MLCVSSTIVAIAMVSQNLTAAPFGLVVSVVHVLIFVLVVNAIFASCNTHLD